MKINRLIVAFSIFAVTSGLAAAQGMPSIAIGLSSISLGQPANEATSLLSQEYTVAVVSSTAPKTERWLISKMAGSKIPVGNLYSQNGKITGFEFDVEVSDDPQNAFNYFVALVNKLTKENHNLCTLTSGTGYLSGPLPLNKTFVDFTCGPYYFYILKNEFHDTQSGEVVDAYTLIERIGETE